MFKPPSGDNKAEPILTHEDCPGCGHRGCLSVWADGGSYCHSCGVKRGGEGEPSSSTVKVTKRRKAVAKKSIPMVFDGEYPDQGLPSRRLNNDTLRKFNVTRGFHNVIGKSVVIFPYRSIKSGDVVAQKLRPKDKHKMRMARGSHAKEPLQLFGQHLWGKEGRKLIITEGEFDAMAVSQVQQHRWPVVSVGGGCDNALDHLLLNLSYLEKFEEIILMFDMDDQGQKAAKKVASELATLMTVKIAHLPLNDPNEMLMQGRDPELISAIFQATEWKPEGVVSLSSLKNEWSELKATKALPYPWDGLTAVTMGIRGGELVTLTAGSGVGKTAVCMEVIYDLLQRGVRTGLIFREQSWNRTIDGLVGLKLGKRIHIDRAVEGLPENIRKIVSERKGIVSFDAEAAREAFDEIVTGDKIVIDKQWGSEDFEDLLSKIKYMAVTKKCEVIILDHISIVISGLDINDERKALDVAMTRLRELCESTGVALIVVSHLKRPDGNKGFEEGLSVTLSHLRGSQAISQLSDMVIALQRNKRHEKRRHWTEVVVLKNRFTGEDGVTACWLRFDEETGRLIESEPDFEAGQHIDAGFDPVIDEVEEDF